MREIFIETDPEKSMVTGKKGTRPLAALHIWWGSIGQIFIDGIGVSGRTLNAGFIIDAASAKKIRISKVEDKRKNK